MGVHKYGVPYDPKKQKRKKEEVVIIADVWSLNKCKNLVWLYSVHWNWYKCTQRAPVHIEKNISSWRVKNELDIYDDAHRGERTGSSNRWKAKWHK